MIKFFEKHFYLSLLITIIGAVLIFYISGRKTQSVGSGIALTSIVYHFYAFFLLSAFLLISILKGKMDRKKIILGIIIAVFYGVSDEIHQIFVPERTFSLFDIMVDATGVLFSSVFYILSFKFRK